MNSHFQRIASASLAVLLVGLLVGPVTGPRSFAASSGKVDIKGKIVLANTGRQTATFRLAQFQRDIKPKKATVLTPKKFPVEILIWDGARPSPKWQPKSLESEGIYTFQYAGGAWSLTKHESKTKGGSASSSKASGTTTKNKNVTKSVRSAPVYRRSTGSVRRVVRGVRPGYYRPAVPVLGRICGDLLWIYRFVRDEEDRDLIRDIIIGREIDDAIAEELWDRLDDLAVNLPAHDRLEFERAMNDLQDLSDADLRVWDDAADEDWQDVRDYLGDQVSDNMWSEIDDALGDFELPDSPEIDTNDIKDVDIDTNDIDANDIDTNDLDTPEIDTNDIGDLDLGDSDLGISSMDDNIDLGDLNTAEDFSFDEGPVGGVMDNIDIGGLGGGTADIDIGDLGTDFSPGAATFPQGGFDAGDFGGGNLGAGVGGGLGGGGDFDAGDFGGGFDAGSMDNGGGFDAGGFDYPSGGFDGGGFGGGFDGGGFGGGFDGGGFGGGFDGGGFGGGGFDGGGFDDFGGGFDDF